MPNPIDFSRLFCVNNLGSGFSHIENLGLYALHSAVLIDQSVNFRVLQLLQTVDIVTHFTIDSLSHNFSTLFRRGNLLKGSGRFVQINFRIVPFLSLVEKS